MMDAHELITRYEAGERDFSWANLYQADLPRAVLYHVNLSGANLAGANLSGAYVTSEQLGKAASLKGAAMPDGTKHE